MVLGLSVMGLHKYLGHHLFLQGADFFVLHGADFFSYGAKNICRGDKIKWKIWIRVLDKGGNITESCKNPYTGTVFGRRSDYFRAKWWGIISWRW